MAEPEKLMSSSASQPVPVVIESPTPVPVVIREEPSTTILPMQVVVAILFIVAMMIVGVICAAVFIEDKDRVTLAIATIVPIVSSLLAVFMVMLQKVSELKAQNVLIHETTNSKMDKLLKITGEAQRAEGVLEGRASAAAEHDHAGEAHP